MSEYKNHVLVHTPTMYWSGRIVSQEADSIILEDAAWIADTGRYADAFETGRFNEVEPVPGRVVIYKGPGVVVVEWPHPLPRVQS